LWWAESWERRIFRGQWSALQDLQALIGSQTISIVGVHGSSLRSQRNIIASRLSKP
jgi:hypothetical protein